MQHPDFKVSCHSRIASLSQILCVGSPCLIIHAKYPVSKQVECHMPSKWKEVLLLNNLSNQDTTWFQAIITPLCWNKLWKSLDSQMLLFYSYNHQLLFSASWSEDIILLVQKINLMVVLCCSLKDWTVLLQPYLQILPPTRPRTPGNHKAPHTSWRKAAHISISSQVSQSWAYQEANYSVLWILHQFETIVISTGFTGYVPKARFLFGAGYPIITNKALIQFGNEMKACRTSFNLQKKDSTSLPLIPSIYPSKTGILPSYMGHVPGM